MRPIVFIHYGDSFYLKPSLICANKYNPNTDIYLLGDEMNKYCDKYTSVIWQSYKNYQKGTLFNIFKNNYNHIGTSNNYFITQEKFCFLRWFILYNFLVHNKLDKCWYFDTDTFICCNLTKYENHFDNYKIAITNRISGTNTIINNKSMILELCQMICEFITDDKFLSTQKKMVDISIDQGKNYNFCDMCVIDELQKKYPSEIGEMTEILNGATFDPNINLDKSDQTSLPQRWEMHKGKKLIYWKRSNSTDTKCYPFCNNLTSNQLVQLLTINMSWVKYKDPFYKETLVRLGIRVNWFFIRLKYKLKHIKQKLIKM